MVVGAPQVHLGIPSAIWNLWKESTHQNHLKTKGISKKKVRIYRVFFYWSALKNDEVSDCM